MIILAIETSCDDTCVAVVEAEKRRYQRRKTQINFNILSNIVSSQVEIHRKWGGVYPTLAKREHQKNLAPVLKEAFKKARLSKISNFQFLISNKIPNSKNQKPKIDLIAVTVGPGLEPCLWVGVNFAKDLAKKWNLPIVPVNHIEAHILVNFQFSIFNFQKLFPAVCLVVSGGHTQLILMRDFGDYKILGETRDDAAGECFDKVARSLGLGYPGGPAIAKQALQWKCQNPNYKLQTNSKFKSNPPGSPLRVQQNSKFLIKLPRPMINQKNYDFSFSGLKTAVLYSFKNYTKGAKLLTGSLAPLKELSSFKKAMAKEVQRAIIDVLIKKTIKAAKDYRAKTIILGGGVAANTELRKQFIENCKLKIENCRVLVPPKKLCTDNAVMTAVAGYYRWLKKGAKLPENIEARANLRIK